MCILNLYIYNYCPPQYTPPIYLYTAPNEFRIVQIGAAKSPIGLKTFSVVLCIFDVELRPDSRHFQTILGHVENN